MATNTFSGARAIFKVNNTVVAYASGVDGTEEVLYEAVDILDRIEVAEYVPVGYRVNFNCSIFRTVNGTKASTGTSAGPVGVPEGQVLGSIKSANYGTSGIFPVGNSTILTNGYLEASVTDKLTKNVLMKYEEVKAQTLNFSITARGIVGQNVSFNAIRFKDESTLAAPA